MAVKQVSGPEAGPGQATLLWDEGVLGCHGPHGKVLAAAQMHRDRGRVITHLKEHCPGDRVVGPGAGGVGLRTTPDSERSLEAAARRYHCTVGMGPTYPAATWMCLVNSIFTPPLPASCPVHPAGGTALYLPTYHTPKHLKQQLRE